MYVCMYVPVYVCTSRSVSHTLCRMHMTPHTVAIPDSDSYSITLTIEMNEILQV